MPPIFDGGNEWATRRDACGRSSTRTSRKGSPARGSARTIERDSAGASRGPVEELHLLLHAAGVQPLVLVGHSLGGYNVRIYQAREGALQPKDITPPGVLVKHAPKMRDAYVASMLAPAPHDTLAVEMEASFESARQVPARRHLGDLPLGTVRGEAVGSPGQDVTYRYTGLGLLQFRNGRIRRQILYGDYPTLAQQLAAANPAHQRD